MGAGGDLLGEIQEGGSARSPDPPSKLQTHQERLGHSEWAGWLTSSMRQADAWSSKGESDGARHWADHACPGLGGGPPSGHAAVLRDDAAGVLGGGAQGGEARSSGGGGCGRGGRGGVGRVVSHFRPVRLYADHDG